MESPYDPSGKPSSADPQFAYDALNRLTNQVDGPGTNTYTTNGLASEGGLWASDTVSYSYHPRVRGLLTNVTVQQPGTANTYSLTYVNGSHN